MRPGFSTDNTTNHRLAYAIFAAKRFLAHTASSILRTNLTDGPFGQLGISVSFAAKNMLWMFMRPVFIAMSKTFWVLPCIVFFAARHPTFLYRVDHVFSLASQKEACRIAARRVIAVVENAQANGNRAVGDDPSNTMGSEATSCAASEAKTAIAVSEGSRRPRPALIRIADLDFLLECRMSCFVSGGMIRFGLRMAVSSKSRRARTVCGPFPQTVHFKIILQKGLPKSRRMP